MSKTKNKTADVLYAQMFDKTPKEVAPLAYGLTLWLNRAEKDVANQIVSLAVTLICILQKYGLSHIDVLSTAENIVFSDKYNNIQPIFKTVIDTFTNKEEI